MILWIGYIGMNSLRGEAKGIILLSLVIKPVPITLYRPLLAASYPGTCILEIKLWKCETTIAEYEKDCRI
jgi:hypothetical protein